MAACYAFEVRVNTVFYPIQAAHEKRTALRSISVCAASTPISSPPAIAAPSRSASMTVAACGWNPGAVRKALLAAANLMARMSRCAACHGSGPINTILPYRWRGSAIAQHIRSAGSSPTARSSSSSSTMPGDCSRQAGSGPAMQSRAT